MTWSNQYRSYVRVLSINDEVMTTLDVRVKGLYEYISRTRRKPLPMCGYELPSLDVLRSSCHECPHFGECWMMRIEDDAFSTLKKLFAEELR